MDRDKYNSGWTVNYDSYFQRAEDHCMKCYYDTLTNASLNLFIVIVVLLLVPFHFETRLLQVLARNSFSFLLDADDHYCVCLIIVLHLTPNVCS
jgi:hypothetical protein